MAKLKVQYNTAFAMLKTNMNVLLANSFYHDEAYNKICNCHVTLHAAKRKNIVLLVTSKFRSDICIHFI